MLQRHQQHQMDDRRRALMTGGDEFVPISIKIGDGSIHSHSVGKGGDTPQKCVPVSDSTIDSNSTNAVPNGEHVKPCSDAFRHDGSTKFPGMAENSASVTSELKASTSVPQICKDFTSRSLDNLEVLKTTESSARHQLVIGCLRVLKKQNPLMSKQNLLQLLCHCSRQQLIALQDKVGEICLLSCA